jgi:hypothetical protein
MKCAIIFAVTIPRIESTPCERSRAIVHALPAGERRMLQPTALEVAASTRVGTPNPIRGFSDMESLFAAMAARVQAKATPPLQADEFRGSLSFRRGSARLTARESDGLPRV